MHCVALAILTLISKLTGPAIWPPLFCLNTTIQRNCPEVVFFHQFNSLATKELCSVFRPSGPIRSTALGERAAICSNRIMIRSLSKTQAKTTPHAAVFEAQQKATDKKIK